MAVTILASRSEWQSSSTLMLVVATVFALLLSYILYYKFLHRLARFPGPLICSLTNLWKLRAVVTDRMPNEILKLHEKYGPVVRIGPNDLSFNAPEAIADIYKQGWPKGDFYAGFTQPEPGIFARRDEKLHSERKRMFATSFSTPSVRSMESIIDSRYAILRRQLDGFAQSGETFDLRKYITYCIVDMLGELAFGQAFDNQKKEDPNEIPPVSEALWGSCVAGQVPWLAGAFAWMRDNMPSPAVREVMVALNLIVLLAVKNIKLRLEKKSDREDILGRLVAAREEKTGQPLTMQQLIADSVTLIVGGAHTTGNTLHILFANLSRNKQHLQRFIEEIDAKLPPLEPDQAAYPISGLEEKLEFVNTAIKESHRKDPVGTFNMPRTVPYDGASIAGYIVPAGVS